MVILNVTASAGYASGQAKDVRPNAGRIEAQRSYGLDPASSLDSRVTATPRYILKMFEEDGRPVPTAHQLTDEERGKLSAAFAALPPLHRRILNERLRSVSFLDGMPNTALTSTVNAGEPFRLFDITIRAPILRQSASEWLTEKERTCFDASGSKLSVSIEAGRRNAVVYVLLHEATHIVDATLGITPSSLSGEQAAGNLTQFVSGTWIDRTVASVQYRDPLRERARFYVDGQTLGIDQAMMVYESLRRTPFTSLYGSSNWYEDLAEYVAIYHWTAILKQPFQIVIRKNGNKVFIYEPMKSALVRVRLDQMRQFY